MALFELPLSGDVVQWINPMRWFLSGNRVNVDLGESSVPELGANALDRVGPYGWQLGQITKTLTVLLNCLPDRASLTPAERQALARSEAMANQVAAIKRKHERPALQSGRSWLRRVGVCRYARL